MNNDIIDISHYLKNHTGLLSKKMNIFLTNLKGDIIIEQQNPDYIDMTNQPKGYYIAFLTDSHGGLIKQIRIIKE